MVINLVVHLLLIFLKVTVETQKNNGILSVVAKYWEIKVHFLK